MKVLWLSCSRESEIGMNSEFYETCRILDSLEKIIRTKCFGDVVFKRMSLIKKPKRNEYGKYLTMSFKEIIDNLEDSDTDEIINFEADIIVCLGTKTNKVIYEKFKKEVEFDCRDDEKKRIKELYGSKVITMSDPKRLVFIKNQNEEISSVVGSIYSTYMKNIYR